ncbi:MAG: hypothetical protein ACON35_05225 [Candidatus Marinamargulisbacteria bacterium]
MNSLIEQKAQSIYSQFSKAPIIEMVQYMVDQSVDAQLLHQLKLIDRKCHKNPHVKSYAERIYASYERICKVLVTYPKLQFKNCQFLTKKEKLPLLIKEYSSDPELDQTTMTVILTILNTALLYGIEANDENILKISNYLNKKEEQNKLIELLKDACGEDYSSYIKKSLMR